MVIRATKDYRDKETKEICLKDSFREVSDERGFELVAKGLAVEYVLKADEPTEGLPDIPDEDAAAETASEEVDAPEKNTEKKTKAKKE